MSTRIIHKQPVVSEDELATAYYRLAPIVGSHAARWTPDRFDSEYIAYVEQGRTIPDGTGEHRTAPNLRNGKYAQYRYPVVELGWV